MWGSWACVPCFFAYGVLYGSAANARWHEAGHGTAFRTRWLNDGVYHLASFMILFEPQVWRWSHARHHTDTIIVGRDPEIVEPRPPSFFKMALSLFSLPHVHKTLGALLRHAGGRLDAQEQTFIPASEGQFGVCVPCPRLCVGMRGAVPFWIRIESRVTTHAHAKPWAWQTPRVAARIRFHKIA